MARAHNLELASTVEVAEVQPDSPASTAGLLAGDRIVAFDKTPTASVDDLHRLLRHATPGTTAELEILRTGKKLTLEVTLRELSR
jgi:serine protease Do